MKMSFDYEENTVEVELKIELKGKIVRGTVKRTDFKGTKGLFFLWDTEKYNKPMLGKDVPSVIREQETKFVLAALYAFKGQRALKKEEASDITKSGFEPVDDDSMFGVAQ
jgi:hypothetical protein